MKLFKAKSKSINSRLEKIMNDNKGNFVINRDGYISTNLKSEVVQSRIRRHIKNLEEVKI